MGLQQVLVFIGLVTAACVLTNRIASKLPVPSLLVFIGLGMLLGVNGPFHIEFSDYELTQQICSVTLLFIMFYGGFNVELAHARPVAPQAVLLSTAGVLVTTGAVGAFAHYVFGIGWLEGMLMGAVISSTDAASVFNVLREHKLSLRYGTDSLLELESGSNDPLSYLLTVVLSTIIVGGDVDVPVMLAEEIGIGIALGVGIGKVAAWVLEHVRIDMAQGETILLTATAIVAFSLPNILHGSGFLAVYLAGMVLGSSDIPAKREMARFFDILTEIAQMAIFFVLGLVVTPALLPGMFERGVLVALFLSLVGRPLAVALVLAPFRARLPQIALASWAGLRGAASVVFSLYALVAGVPGSSDLFNVVFIVVLLSLIAQGSLLPAVARRLDMVDAGGNVMTTFNDFQEDSDLSFVKLKVGPGHPFIGRALADIDAIGSLLVALVLRDGAHVIIPDGQTVVREGDLLVIAAPTFEQRPDSELALRESVVGPRHRWAGRLVRDLPGIEGGRRFLIVMVDRGGESIIPNGDTRIEAGDKVVVATL